MGCGLKGSTHHLGERVKNGSETPGRMRDETERVEVGGACGGLAEVSDGPSGAPRARTCSTRLRTILVPGGMGQDVETVVLNRLEDDLGDLRGLLGPLLQHRLDAGSGTGVGHG